MPIELRKILPTGMRFRELWLPGLSNNNASLPSSVNGGRALTQTGSQGRTTADGVKGDGTVNSNISLGAIHNAAAKLWVSLRFKLSAPFAAGGNDQFIWGKQLDANNWLFLYLSGGTGTLRFRYISGGVTVFNIAPATVSWAANTWFHVISSISNVNAVRLVVDNGAAITDPDVTAAPNGGSIIVLHRVAGFILGFEGVIADVVIGTDDLTAAEEADLAKGIPPSDAVNRYLLDEGMGVTAYDRGSGGNNGTLGATATWQFGGCKRPVLSFDGINDVAQSASGIDLTGSMTRVWVGKMKSTYSALAGDHHLFRTRLDGNNQISLWYVSATDQFAWDVVGGGTQKQALFTYHPAIDDYAVLMATVDAAGAMVVYLNGVSVATQTGATARSSSPATAYIGATQTPGLFDVSKPLMLGAIHGALSASQVLNLSRYLDQKLKMGIGI